MDNLALFMCGVIVSLIVGMGIITSQVFLGYKKFMQKHTFKKNVQYTIENIGTNER
jgi:hypothetical protein